MLLDSVSHLSCRFSQPIFPDVVDLPASQPGYGSLHHNNNVTNGDVDPYSKLNRRDTGSSCDTSASAEYSRLQHGSLSQMNEVSLFMWTCSSNVHHIVVLSCLGIYMVVTSFSPWCCPSI